MSLNRIWIYMVLAFFAMGFTFPGTGSKQKKETKAAPAKVQAAAPVKPAPQKAAPKAQLAAVSNDEEDEGEDEEEADTIPTVPAPLAKLPKVPGQSEMRLAKAGSPEADAAAKPAMDILKTQKQIREILHLNESLKARYRSQAGEIQKISEQAKIHQKILQDLESAKSGGGPGGTVKAGPKPSSVEEQKIKLIQQETDQQHRFIKKLEQEAPTAEVRKTGTVKPAQAKVQ